MAHNSPLSVAPRLMLGIFIALTLALLSGPALAQEDAGPMDIPAGVRLMPALDGYPIGQTLPMLFLVKLPDGQEISKESMAKPMELKMAIKGVKIQPGQLITFGPGQDMAIMRLDITAQPDAKPGRQMVPGAVTLYPKEGDPVEAPFMAPVNILPKDGKPIIIAADMLKRLGIEPPANGVILKEGEVPPGAMNAPPAQAQTQAQGEAPAQAEPAATAEAAPPAQDPYAGKSLILILALVFAGGLALNLTPCVYPLIPITVGFFGGRAQGGEDGQGGGRAGLLVSALAYWAGMAITYTVLGAFVALSGRLLGEALTHPAVLAVIIVVILVMAASMFGLWEIRLPASLNRLAGASRGGVGGALIMGLTVGLLAAPCVGPFVVGLMTHVAQVAQVGYGLLVFFVLAVGLGLPLAALAFFSGMVTHLPGAGGWMIWVRRLFGVVLVLMAVNVGRPLLSEASYNWLLAVVAGIGAIYLGFLEPSGRGRLPLVQASVRGGRFGGGRLVPGLFARGSPGRSRRQDRLAALQPGGPGRGRRPGQAGHRLLHRRLVRALPHDEGGDLARRPHHRGHEGFRGPQGGCHQGRHSRDGALRQEMDHPGGAQPGLPQHQGRDHAPDDRGGFRPARRPSGPAQGRPQGCVRHRAPGREKVTHGAAAA